MAVNVYMITNKVNGKQYIGITKFPIEKRWRAHLSDVRKGKQFLIQRAIRKYGPEAFEMKLLCVCPDREYANNIERGLIAAYDTMNTGYNNTEGGEGTHGYKLSPEQVERMKKSFDTEKKREASRENQKKAAAARRGKPMSEEHKRRISEAHKAKGHKPNLTDDALKKIGDAQRGRPKSEEQKAKTSASITAWHAARKAAKAAAYTTQENR